MIQIKIEWEDMEPDGRKCSSCETIIEDKMYIMFMDFGDPLVNTPVCLNYTLCESCYLDFLTE